MQLDEKTELLSAVLTAPRDSAMLLGREMRYRSFAPSTILAHQGDSNDTLWLITEGTLQLQTVSANGQATVIAAFGPGQMIGGYADQDASSFDIKAFTPTAALEIRAVVLADLLDTRPELGAGLSRIYAGQLHAVLDRLSSRVSLSAAGRFYRELLRLAGSQDTIAPPPIVAALALTAQTTRETGSRAINRLERRGIISRDDQQLTIHSRRLLAELIL